MYYNERVGLTIPTYLYLMSDSYLITSKITSPRALTHTVFGNAICISCIGTHFVISCDTKKELLYLSRFFLLSFSEGHFLNTENEIPFKKPIIKSITVYHNSSSKVSKSQVRGDRDSCRD